MHYTSKNLPIAFEADGVSIRQADWGDMTASLEHFPAGLETAPLFMGLPGDRCQCPHWGFVIKGRLRIRYADHDEVVIAGEAYYMAPGHTSAFEDDTDVIEFSPRGLYQETMEVAARNLAAMHPS